MDGVNEILNEVRKHLVLPVDFKAQERIEKLAYVILGIGAVTSFGIGFVTQSLQNLLVCFGGLFVVTLIVTLPPYSCYKKNQLKWVQPKVMEIKK